MNARETARLSIALLTCLAVAAAVAQGVGSASAPTERPTYHYDDYAPYGRTAAGLFKFGQWSTVPVDAVTTWVYWGDPRKWQDAEIEEHAVLVHPVDGRRWVWVRAYIDQKLQRRYAIATTRAELLRNGKVEDVTPPAGMEGQPYALADFNGPFTVRAWGTVIQDPQVCAARKSPPPADLKEDGCNPQKRRRWFWQHTITPVAAVQNPCWAGVGPAQRPVLQQEEVWWDSSGGWARGSGALDGAGNPTGEGLTYQGMQTIAKGVGFAWTGAQGNCLLSTPATPPSPVARPVR